MILRHETSDVEQVTALARLAFASEDARVDLFGRPPPRLVAELVCLGELTVAQSSGSVGRVVGVGTVMEAVLCVPLAGGGEARVHGERLTLEPGRRGALMGPGAAVRMNLGEGWRMASIKLPRAHLEGQLQALLGEPTALPRLAPALRLDGPEAEVGRLARVLVDVAVREPRAGPVVVSLAEALGRALLLCQPAVVQALDAQAAGAPVHLRRAEAWLEAHLYGPVSMTELATVSGLGLRSLQRLFLAHRGVGPLGFLQGLRLAQARARLALGAPNSSVAEVAAALCFSSPGRFAALYRARFGESPSETLRAGRRRVGSTEGDFGRPEFGALGD